MTLKRICVIGGGVMGICSAKALLEVGLEPVVLERTGHMGGIWRYHEEDVEGLASVMKSTIINSSKEMSAFSDFPPPAHFPNYMRHHQVNEYVMAYAEKFGVLQYVQTNKEVQKVDFADDYDKTGRLCVVTRDTVTNDVTSDLFDGVIVCIGHHVYPNVPSFPGMDRFKGKCVHTHSLKVVECFQDQNVVIVGVGNSGVDAACEISSVSKQVYLASRKGAWVLPRVGPGGVPFDVIASRRYLNVLFKTLPYRFSCWVTETMLDHYQFNHENYNMKPTHRVWSQHPTISDNLPIKLLSGAVLVRRNIKEFVEDGVIFDGEEAVTPVDSVVFATGYQIRFPFLSENLTSIKDNETHLYKFVFPPHLKHPCLALPGLFQSLGGGFPIGEAQVRWISLVFKRVLSLPSMEDMENDIQKRKKYISKRFVSSKRHTVQVDYIPYLDELNSLLSTKPNMFKMMFKDPVLFWNMLFGPSLPYQYRLTGHHSWPEARKTILGWKKRVDKPLKNESEKKTSKK